MLSSLLRPRHSRQSVRPSSYFADVDNGSPGPNAPYRRSSDLSGEEEVHYDEDADGEGDEDGNDEATPLLPIFSAPHLDTLPVYNLTHAIRLLIVSRCETTLTWDQLRSPQVSQFLVKPIQQQILASHFNSATLYALMANCLQFNKEVRLEPGTAGTSKTRALVCELLAMRLLKEYTTRQLVNALSYEFFPLQGISPPNTGSTYPIVDASSKTRALPRAAKSSTLEIAIRAQAKKFLAHPLVVRQLEAIWAGTIVFHHAADNLHRSTSKRSSNKVKKYGSLTARPAQEGPGDYRGTGDDTTPRRSVTIYDPREASLFKLSRLRVPRYRQFLSTCSYAILLSLYLAVLIERSLDISGLEVVLWFWSAGFMLDEIVGFNEQGFSLYIMSIWNTFDVGILLLFVIYYGMRLYGIAVVEDRKHHFAGMAYDVLAANAVLLFPRLFSVLDHYRYFSQLLIAFRMMMLDLVAIMTLIVVACSGFFVAFTLSFTEEDHDASAVAYALFQIVMGFTPAAWQNWDSYNILGKAILTIFLFICHFVILVILITVLTNSFMAIVQNANEEHQFVFAVNTISLVKSDALFSYVAPTNALAWFLTPLRYVLPFSNYVWVNRVVIKITHFPILWAIYAYETIVLQRAVFAVTDLVDDRHQRHGKNRVPMEEGALRLFSPHHLREPSIRTFQKERALDEVFRRPFRDSTLQGTQKTRTRENTSNVVSNWMQGMGPDGRASPPMEQDPSVVKRLEARRPLPHSFLLRRKTTAGETRDFTNITRSVISDPEDLTASVPFRRPLHRREDSDLLTMSMSELREHTEAGGDDELSTNDEEDVATLDRKIDENDTGPNSSQPPLDAQDEGEYFKTPTNARLGVPQPAEAAHDPASEPPLYLSRASGPSPTPVRHHNRNFSSATVMYDPERPDRHLSTSSSSPVKRPTTRGTPAGSRPLTPNVAARHAHRRTAAARTPKPRPMMPPRSQYQSVPNLSAINIPRPRPRHRSSSIGFDLTSDLGDNNPRPNLLGGVPASFATNFLDARVRSGLARERHESLAGTDESSMMTRLVLARMNTLEESFKEVLKEVKDWRKEESRSGGGPTRRSSRVGRRKEGKRPRSGDGGLKERRNVPQAGENAQKQSL